MDLMDYRRKIVANSPHLASASGAVAHFVDGADGLPLKSLVVNIEPKQEGTGDPSPDNVRPISGWDTVKVTRTAKNLLDTSVMHSGLLTLTVGASEDSVTQSSRYGYSDRIPSTSAMVISARSDDTTNYNWVRVIQYVNGIVVAVIGGFEDIESTKTLAIPARENSYIRVMYGAKRAGAVSTSVIGYTQVELGSTATPYEPYNGVNVSIDLGQTVYGGTLNVLTGVLTVYPYYAAYNGETLTGRWVSDRNKYVAGTTPTIGAQVVDMSGTGTEIQLTPQQIRTLYGDNTIFADTGNVALEYWAHP